jgi:hypothetical protein
VRCQIGKARRNDHDIGIQSVDRLDITIDGQASDQTIRPQGFTCHDQPCELRTPSPRCQFVCLQCGHIPTLSAGRAPRKPNGQPEKLYSEDLQPGAVIGGVRVVNPFVA